MRATWSSGTEPSLTDGTVILEMPSALPRNCSCVKRCMRCSLLVTLGTPYRGAARAIGAIAHGIPRVPGHTGERHHDVCQRVDHRDAR